jgi:hypothetical protein
LIGLVENHELLAGDVMRTGQGSPGTTIVVALPTP